MLVQPSLLDRLWIEDFTYVPNWTGMVYVAFVIDEYSRADPGLAGRDF